MSDEEFAQAMLRGVYRAPALHHRDHLRLVWYLARQYDPEVALALVKGCILVWAAQHERISVYHETLTRFWVRMIAWEVAHQPDNLSFEAFLLACPDLLDKRLPYRYWKPETLDSPVARAAWVEPDVQRMPD